MLTMINYVIFQIKINIKLILVNVLLYRVCFLIMLQDTISITLFNNDSDSLEYCYTHLIFAVPIIHTTSYLINICK